VGSPGEDGRARLLTRPFLLVQLSTLGLFLALGTLLPTLPRFARGELGAGSVGVGLVVGASSITALLFQPPAGRLSDRRGRRLLIVAGGAVASAATAACTLAGSVPELVAFRLVTLMTFALAAAPPGERSSVVGTFSAFLDVALALGALVLGGVAAVTSYGGAFLAGAVASAAGLLLLARLPAGARAS
jgi:MFS family permease